LLHDIVVLYADDLINSVAQSCHLLAAFVQQVLRQAKLYDRVVAELPLLLWTKLLNYVLLFIRPISFGTWSLNLGWV